MIWHILWLLCLCLVTFTILLSYPSIDDISYYLIDLSHANTPTKHCSANWYTGQEVGMYLLWFHCISSFIFISMVFNNRWDLWGSLLFNLPGLCSSYGVWHTIIFHALWQCTLWACWSECPQDAVLPPKHVPWTSSWQWCHIGFV